MKVLSNEKRYVVTGDREVTSVLTVHDDGRWELSKGTLYDVTHLPCRSGLYTTPPGQPASACTPDASAQKSLSGQTWSQDASYRWVCGAGLGCAGTSSHSPSDLPPAVLTDY